MRKGCTVQLRLIIESDRVNHQRIPVPPADRVAHPRGVQVLGVFVGSVRINLPDKVVALEELDYTARDLNNLERKGMHVDSRNTGREASDFIARSRVDEIGGILYRPRSPGRLGRLVQRLSPGSHWRNSRDKGIPGPGSSTRRHGPFPPALNI